MNNKFLLALFGFILSVLTLLYMMIRVMITLSFHLTKIERTFIIINAVVCISGALYLQRDSQSNNNTEKEVKK